jgi:hypothetical protein
MEVAFDSENDVILAGDLTGIVHVWNAKDAVVLGQLNTNPPPLVKQIELAMQGLAAAEVVANQAVAGVGGLTKAIADRKGAAEAAVKVAAATVVAMEAATKEKVTADADLTAKTQALQTAETNLTATQAAQTKAAVERDAINKLIADLRTKAKMATESVAAAEAEMALALAAYEAKPDDADLKAAHAAANKKLVEMLNFLSESSKLASAAVQELPAKSEAFMTTTALLNGAKVAREKSIGEKTVSEKVAVDTVAKLKAATEGAVVAKANADKAVVEAIVTPEQQKQLTDAEAGAKVATDKSAAVKAQLERLNAAKGRTFQTADSSSK